MAFMFLPAVLAQVAVSQVCCGEVVGCAETVCEEPGTPVPGATRFAFKAATELNDPRLYYTGKVKVGFPAKPHMAVWKLNEHGAELWRRDWHDAVSGIDAYGVAVEADLDGNVYAAGVVEGPKGKDIIVLKYGPTGTLLWERRFDAKNVAGNSLGDDVPVVIRHRAIDGYVYIGGDSQSVSPTGASIGFNYVLLKLHGETGVPRWGFDSTGQPVVARYNGTANGDDHLADLLVTAVSQSTLALNGYEAVATGASPGVGTSSDMATILFTDDPLVMEVLRYDSPMNGKDGGTSLTLRTNAPLSDGLFVTGFSSGQTASTGYDFVTVAYTHEDPPCVPLCQRWVAVYNNTGSNGTDMARDIVHSSAGGTVRVFVTGESWSATMGYEFATIAYSALTGVPVWTGTDNVRRFNANNTTGDDLPSDLAVDYEGNLYVAGQSTWGATQDISVMSYFPNGNPHWLPDGQGREFVIYNGTGSGKDFGAAIGLYNDFLPRFGVFGTVFSNTGASIAEAYGVVRYFQSNP